MSVLNLPLTQTSPASIYEPPDFYWRSLYFLSGYRFVVALALLAVTAVFGTDLSFGSAHFELFVLVDAAYLVFSLLCFPLIASHRHFHLQLSLGISADIAFVTVMMFASGGIGSGLGLLSLSGIAAAGFIARGRVTLLFASLGSIAVLLEHTVQVLYFNGVTAQYVQAGLLSLGYFTIAAAAHTLAKYLLATEQLAAQREIDLANMAEVSQLVMQDMDDGVLVVDENRMIRQYNARTEEMLGAVRQPRGAAKLEDYSPLLAQRLEEWRSVAAGGGAPNTTVVLNDKLSARFMRVSHSRDVAAVIFLEDLSQVQTQAREMKLAALGRLTANIAHEIRNPLSAISHATELLLEEAVADDTTARLLTIIYDNARRLNSVVNDVLKLNRGQRAHREIFKVSTYLQTFIEQFSQVEKIEKSLFLLEQSGDPEVLFDHSHLNQVMWNLCRNALRHCSRRNASILITVSLTRGGNIVRLDVVDDGPGVPADLRNQLFEPFFTTVSSGTGLGLYLAREVCEANEATLDYVETPVGACFSISCRRA